MNCKTKKEIMSFSFSSNIAQHIRQQVNMSAYMTKLVLRDIEEKNYKSILEQIKLLLSGIQTVTNNCQLDTLSAINSLIGEDYV